MVSSLHCSLAWLTLLASVASAGPFEIVGCYVLPTSGVLFSSAFSFADQPDVTYEKCVARCPTSATLYAIADGYTCYCGTTIPTTLQTAPAADCRYLCSGDDTQWCGGPSRADIFKKNGTFTNTPSTFTTVTSRSSAAGSSLNTNPPGGATSAPTLGQTTGLPGRPTTSISTRPPTTSSTRPGTTAPPGPPGGQTTAPPGQGQTTAPPRGGTTAPPSTRSTSTRRTTSRCRDNDEDCLYNTVQVATSVVAAPSAVAQNGGGSISIDIEQGKENSSGSSGGFFGTVIGGVTSIISGITGSISISRR